MSMFDSYNNINTDTGSNTEPQPINPIRERVIPPIIKRRSEAPYEDYNANGELIGYYWYYGDTFDLDFTILGTVQDDDGQYVSIIDFLKDSGLQSIIFRLYDFRYNEILKLNPYKIEDNKVKININQNISNQLLSGTYHCSLELVENTTGNTIPIFEEDYTTLTVQ